MLNPYKNRYDYGSELKPPYKYKLDFAIGTTYTLSFDALIGACFSLCQSMDTDDVKVGESLDSIVLALLNKINNKIAIYCDSGKISKPKKESILYIKLEDSIFEIKEDGIFHPKFWLISYVNEKGNKKYRLIVLSRNITFDNSWDIIAVLDGEKGKKNTKNKPIIDFLEFLKKNTTNNKVEKIEKMQKELQEVEFNCSDENFEDFEFIPSGISSKNNFEFPYNSEIFIMSPFLTSDIVSRFATNNNVTLVTRQTEINNINSKDFNKMKVYTLSDDMSFFEEDEQLLHDIHAKIYHIKNERTLLIGSKNATSSAFTKNIELLLKLKCREGFSIKKDILYPKANSSDLSPFSLVTSQDLETDKEKEEKQKEEKIRKIVKEITRSKTKAYAYTTDKNDKVYKNILEFNNFPFNTFEFDVKVKPYFSNKIINLNSKEIVFDDLREREISMFYEFRIYDNKKLIKEFIMKIDTDIKPDNRSKYISNKIIERSEDFDAYLNFLIDDTGISTFIHSIIPQDTITISGNFSKKELRTIKSSVLYEDLLKKIIRDKDIIKDIDRVIKETNDGVVDKEFKELMKAFSEALK